MAHFIKRLRNLLGDLTFLEAYERSGEWDMQGCLVGERGWARGRTMVPEQGLVEGHQRHEAARMGGAHERSGE
jgi:hypothetical protein